MTTAATRPAIAAARARLAAGTAAPIATARPAIAAAAHPVAEATPVAAAGSDRAYGLRRPTVIDARASIDRVYGAAEGDAIWAELVGAQTLVAAPTVEQVVQAMLTSRHDIVRLCGQSIEIRLRSFTHLSAAAEAIVR